MQIRPVVIVSACRTAVGKFGGALASVSAAILGSRVIKEVVVRATVKEEKIDEVIMGCVLSAGQRMNIARQAAMAAGIPEKVPAYTVNKVCGSGLKAVVLGAQAIALGEADIVVAGGMESMSQAPYLLPEARWGSRMGHRQIIDSMVSDGLWDAFCDCHMGETAENIAQEFSISRREQDEFAVESQKKCAEAIRTGKFSHEIVPVSIPQKKGEVLEFLQDEFPRPDTTVEVLSKLKPAFRKNGTVTAGNASGISDGAAAVLLMTEEMAQRMRIPILARLLASASVGVSPAKMGSGPVPAVGKVLLKSGLKITEVDLFEINEAFAVQTIAVARLLKIPEERLNVYGGAIALGHPIGASGARILVTLLSAMADRGARRGLASLCIGGGMGMAAVVECD